MNDKKPLQMVGKFLDMSFDRKGDKRRSERFYLLIPPELVHDERFPLQKDELAMIRIEGLKLIVMKLAPVE